VGTEVSPEHPGVGTLHTMTGMEEAVDGDTGVLGDSSLDEFLAAGLMDESLNAQDLSNGVFPLVQVVA
jgi:hypothetical protein